MHILNITRAIKKCLIMTSDTLSLKTIGLKIGFPKENSY